MELRSKTEGSVVRIKVGLSRQQYGRRDAGGKGLESGIAGSLYGVLYW
jgi:hypothetical protein